MASLKKTKSADVEYTPNIRPTRSRKSLKMRRAKTEFEPIRPRKSRKKLKRKTENKKTPYKIPRKLGPRDIGRNKYEGTVYIDNDKTPFLKEKIHKHSRASSFALRKSKNPIKKRKTLSQIGSPNGWGIPSFSSEIEQEMKRIQLDQWLKERPIKPPNNKLDALKGTKAPKRGTVSEVGAPPKGWNEIEYKYNEELGTFLNEKLWFEGSRAPMLNGLSHMIEALPAERKIELNILPSPTGIHSKIKFLRTLRDIIMEQVKLIRQEEKMLQKYQSQRTLKVINSFEGKYKKLLKRRCSSVEKSRRKLFTMKSVHALDVMISNMEKQHKSTAFKFEPQNIMD